jgi:phosphoglycerate dehydrogenase-like enzyme
VHAKKRVLVDMHPRKAREVFTEEDWARLASHCEVVWGKDEPLPAEVFEQGKSDLFAIIGSGWRYGDIKELPEIRAILEVGGGLPHPRVLDYETCFQRHVRVLSCAPAFGPMVAEMALGMALACSREIVRGHELFRACSEKYSHAGNKGTFTLFGRSVGFIGYGSIARNLQPLLEPFRCRFLAYDPWLTETYLRHWGVVPASLEAVMSGCDVVFALAVPTTGNKGMIERRHFELMRRDSVFVLMSRAHVVDFDALTDLVGKGRFRAAIDVFPEEPLDRGHPIRAAASAVLSAHRAGSVEDDLRTIGRMVVDDLEAILCGLPPRHMQNAEPELVGRL